MSPDKLRTEDKAVGLVREFFDAGKPIAAICHGPWLLAEAGIVNGLEVTSWPSLRTDLENAGATRVDRDVVTVQGIVTSRKPADIPAFTRKLIEEIGEGLHERVPSVAGVSR
jgi:protease I